MSTFTGFSEEELKRVKSAGTVVENCQTPLNNKPSRLNQTTHRKTEYRYKTNLNQTIDDAIDDLQFDKCRLKPTNESSKQANKAEKNTLPADKAHDIDIQNSEKDDDSNVNNIEHINNNEIQNVVSPPDVVKGVDYVEDELASHRAKLEELQMKQKIMEEQNKKRKEMLAKALADRTRQTEEEVLKLDKIKKELQVLDGQFSQDVSVLRKKIDIACLTYSEAEKHYLRVEKEFLQAKIQLQKEKERKELLTEHLCALITHNETRKAQKLETLMLELATNKTHNLESNKNIAEPNLAHVEEKNDIPEIVDGVDQKTGKMVEFHGNS